MALAVKLVNQALAVLAVHQVYQAIVVLAALPDHHQAFLNIMPIQDQLQASPPIVTGKPTSPE